MLNIRKKQFLTFGFVKFNKLFSFFNGLLTQNAKFVVEFVIKWKYEKFWRQKMLGQKIKELRQKEGMIQKALADKLYVTAQAVSRWENEEVEPSVSTLAEISKVFGITLDELVGGEKVVEKVVEKEYVIKEQQPVLALCEQCNNPIFNKDEIVRKPYGRGQTRILCKSCDSKNNERERAERIENSKKKRIRSFQ